MTLWEVEKLKNILTFFTSNLFLIVPAEVDATEVESTSIPSGSAIFVCPFAQAQLFGLETEPFPIQDVGRSDRTLIAMTMFAFFICI